MTAILHFLIAQIHLISNVEYPSDHVYESLEIKFIVSINQINTLNDKKILFKILISNYFYNY